MNSEEIDAGQGDKLIWILGGVVAVVAVAFFAFMNIGTDHAGESSAVAASEESAADVSERPIVNESGPVDFSVQLNRARLAVDANMLTEPEGYSAWSIYTEILDADADADADAENAQAAEGLAIVAERLIDQASGALTSGRRSDAAALANRVLSRFPDNTEAAEIAAQASRDIVVAEAPREAAPALPDNPAPAVARVTQQESATVAPEPELVDPIVAVYSGFTTALAEGALRGSGDGNAAAYLNTMRATDAEHAMTLEAEQQLFEAIFARHNDAFDQLDSDAALDWLDAAETLQLNPERIASARDQILDAMAVQAATESIAATELVVRNYVPPRYPNGAVRRNIEGWVDIAFVLSREGRPMSVEVTEASNTIFRDSATAAVEQWEFEPHTVHDRIVEQHAHTRIRFELED